MQSHCPLHQGPQASCPALKAQAKQPTLVQPFDLQVLDQVADEKSLIIAVGYMLRSSPAVVAAKRLMQEVRTGHKNCLFLLFICCYDAQTQLWSTFLHLDTLLPAELTMTSRSNLQHSLLNGLYDGVWSLCLLSAWPVTSHATHAMQVPTCFLLCMLSFSSTIIACSYQCKEPLHNVHKHSGMRPKLSRKHSGMLQIGVTPASIVGRYSCPYNNIAKPQWWDTQKSGGCIVEQATHFVDLMRYLSGGDIIQESIQAVAVGPDMALKEMPAHPQAEHLVSPAIYQYAMTHALLRDTCTICVLLAC